jgi:hypothetical protein
MIQKTLKKYHLKILVVSFKNTSSIKWYINNQLLNYTYFLSSY